MSQLDSVTRPEALDQPVTDYPIEEKEADNRNHKGELLVSALLLIMGAFTLQQAATMEVIGDSTPGPEFFPAVVGGLLVVSGLLIALHWLRSDGTTRPDAADAPMDWKSLGGVVVSFLAFILLLEPLGWFIAASALFWAISSSLGGKNNGSNVVIALIFAAITQIIFSIGLGISLPSGIIGGIGSWIS